MAYINNVWHQIIRNHLKYLCGNAIMIIQKESTHSKSGCPEFRRIIVLTDDAYPVGQTG